MSINAEREPLLEHSLDAVPAPQGTGSVFHGTISVVKICIGTGVLALPYAFQQSGIITGVIVLAFVALWNAYTSSILLECATALRKRGISLQAERSTLSGIARHATGIWGVYLLDFSLFFTTFGVCTTYQITVGQLLSSAFEGLGMPYHPANQQLMMLAAAILIYPMTRLKSLEILAKTAGVALLSLFISFIIIFASGYEFPTAAQISPLLYAKSINSFSIFFGIVVFSFGIPAAMFPIQEGMKDPSQFKRSLFAGLGVVYITYTILGVLGLLLYVNSPAGVQEIILNSLPDQSPGTYAVKILQSLVCIFSTPLVWMVPGQMLDSMIKHKRTNFVCQTVAFFCTTAIALFVPFFGLVVSFIGCFAVSGYSFILPPLFHWQLCRKESSNCSACLDFFCFLLGIVTVCVTSYQSALAIAEQL